MPTFIPLVIATRIVCSTVMFAITVIVASAQNFQWSTIPSFRVEQNENRVVTVGDDLVGFAVADYGAWITNDGTIFRQLVPDSVFNLVALHVRIVATNTGIVVLAGQDTENNLNVAVCKPPYDSFEILPAELGFREVIPSFRNSDQLYSQFGGTIVIDRLYSTDDGESWGILPLPPGENNIVSVQFSTELGLICYAPSAQVWYRFVGVEWQEFDLGVPANRVAIAADGAMVAVDIVDFTELAKLWFKKHTDSAWVQITEVCATSGRCVPTRSFFGSHRLYNANSRSVVMPLDSGMVAIFNSDGISAINLPESAHKSVAQRSGFDFAVNTDYMSLRYGNRRFIVSNTNNIATELTETELLSSVSHTGLIGSTVFVHDSHSTGHGLAYGGDELWHSSMMLQSYEANSELQYPSTFTNIITAEQEILTIPSDGIFEFRDLTGELIAKPFTIRSQQSESFFIQAFRGNRRISSGNRGVYTTGSQSMLYSNDTSYRLPFTNLSTVIEHEEVVYAANTRIYRSSQDLITWDTLNAWPQLADQEPSVSSMVIAGNKMVVGLRGYQRVANSDTLFATTSGVWVSDDDGESWQDALLPTQNAWVENIVRVGNGRLIAWVKDVDLVGLQSPGAIQGLYDESAYLAISTDGGVTWTKTYDSKANGDQLEMLHSWRITDNGTLVYATSPYDGVLVSTNNGESWEHINLPEEIIANDIAVSNDTVYVAHTAGIYVHTGVTSVTRNDVGSVEFECNVYPNPASESLVVEVKNLNHKPVRLAVCNTIGEEIVMATLMPDSGSRLHFDCSAWPASSYVLRLWDGERHTSKVFAVVR